MAGSGVGVAASFCFALGIARESSGATPSGATPRLNVVLIVSDDERLDANRRMRNVQRLLAREGMRFDRYYTTTSECCPSRASILTGRYPHHSGVVANFGPHGYPSFDDRSTLATWLHDAGYTTALVGKYLNGYTLDGDHRVPPVGQGGGDGQRAGGALLPIHARRGRPSRALRATPRTTRRPS